MDSKRQIGPVSEYCGWVGMSCPVSVAWHSCVAPHWSKYHCYKKAPSRYELIQMYKWDVKTQTEKTKYMYASLWIIFQYTTFNIEI